MNGVVTVLDSIPESSIAITVYLGGALIALLCWYGLMKRVPKPFGAIGWLLVFAILLTPTVSAGTNASIAPGGYGNFYATHSISHYEDSSFDFSNTFVGGTNGLRIWVDWNNNLTFEDSEVVFFLSNSDLTKTGTITVPAGTANGDYRIRVRAQWGTGASPTACGVISYGEALDFKLIVDNSLSTGSFDNASFKVYPNPVTDILTLAHSNTISEVIVYNLLGQQVLTMKPNATQTQVDLSELNTGTYMVKITSDEVSKTVKVVKN